MCGPPAGDKRNSDDLILALASNAKTPRVRFPLFCHVGRPNETGLSSRLFEDAGMSNVVDCVRRSRELRLPTARGSTMVSDELSSSTQANLRSTLDAPILRAYSPLKTNSHIVLGSPKS